MVSVRGESVIKPHTCSPVVVQLGKEMHGCYHPVLCLMFTSVFWGSGGSVVNARG